MFSALRCRPGSIAIAGAVPGQVGAHQHLLGRTFASSTSAPAASATTSTSQKRAGDISDAFVSLSGQSFKPLGPEYAALKRRLIAGREDAVRDSWIRLLRELRDEIPYVAELKSKVVPQVRYEDIVKGNVSEEFASEHRKRGVAVVRGVLGREEALGMKDELKEYIRANPHTKAFPADSPQVFELYWSPAQMRARTHPALLNAQKYLMSYWHSRDPDALVSTQHPTAYADRLRMRLPGDAKFALGPHVDGGSVERWDERGYGRGGVYDQVWKGNWEAFDPWESSCRLNVESDLHQGVGACSSFRMAQGWLSMSSTGPFEGTLLVNPLLAKATAYYLLRPFFSPKRPAADAATDGDIFGSSFLHEDNWVMESEPTSLIQGATPGHGQELNHLLHPHLNLPKSMVHMPRVEPGDYVAWHCDTIHAVDQTHAGTSDSSVLYIPTCPLTEAQAHYLVRQRDCFERGVPSPDFGGGEGESRHSGRPGIEEMKKISNVEGLRALGLAKWDTGEQGLAPGQQEVLKKANEVLGF